MGLVSTILGHPLTRGLDIDDPKTTELRKEIIFSKPFLCKIYRQWYSLISANLPAEDRPPPALKGVEAIRDAWNRLHLQVIYFGREHCPARGHDLSRCPICSWAAAQTRTRTEKVEISLCSAYSK